MISSIVFFIMLFCFALAAERLVAAPLRDDEGRFAPFAGIDSARVMIYAMVAGLVALINLALKKGFLVSVTKGWIAVPMLIALLGVCAAIIWWWRADGGKFREAIAFSLMAAVVCLVLKSSALAVAALIHNPDWADFVGKSLPWLIFLFMIGCFAVGTVKVWIRDGNS